MANAVFSTLMRDRARLKQASRLRRGSVVTGLIVFFAGIAMILFAFKLAFDLYSVPPALRVDAVAGRPVDLTRAGESLTQTLIRILVIAIMAAIGGVVANRGISMYASTRVPPKSDKKAKKANSEPEAESSSAD